MGEIIYFIGCIFALIILIKEVKLLSFSEDLTLIDKIGIIFTGAMCSWLTVSIYFINIHHNKTI